jgi:ribonuclease HI
MKYHTISTSKTGHGAVFTNLKDAESYQKGHPGSMYSVFDQMPARIPPNRIPAGDTEEKPVSTNEEKCSGIIDPSLDITIYTDGACSGNPGPAGSGAVIMQNGTAIHEISESLGHATNNIAELTAIKLALEYLFDYASMPITLYTDSVYCIGSLTKNWKAKKNIELIGSIKDVLTAFTKLSIKHIKGHNGDPGNERADKLAVKGSLSS